MWTVARSRQPQHGADHAVQTTRHCQRDTADRHHRGFELWQPAMLRSGACAATAVEELWREMDPARHEARKAASGTVYRLAKLSQRCGVEEQAAGWRGRFGRRADVTVLDAVPAYGRHPRHPHRNLGRAGGWPGKAEVLTFFPTHSPTHKVWRCLSAGKDQFALKPA